MVLSTTRPNGLSSTLRTRSARTGAGGASPSAPERAAFGALARAKITVNVKVAEPATSGVPLISPFTAVRPFGKDPVTVKVYGLTPPEALKTWSG